MFWYDADKPNARTGTNIWNQFHDFNTSFGGTIDQHDAVMTNLICWLSSYNGHSAFGGDYFGYNYVQTEMAVSLQENWWIDCWTYFDPSVAGNNLFGAGTTAASSGLHIVYNGTNESGVRFGMYSNDTDFTHGMTAGNWYHLAFGYNDFSPYKKSMFVDGVELTGTVVGSQGRWLGGSDHISIGKSYGSTYTSQSTYGGAYFAVVRFYYYESITAKNVQRNFRAEQSRFK